MAFKTIKIREEDHPRLRAISKERRWTQAETVAALLDETPLAAKKPAKKPRRAVPA
jgi:hypothetical protein